MNEFWSGCRTVITGALIFLGWQGLALTAANEDNLPKPVLSNSDFELDPPGVISHPQGWLFSQHAGDQSFELLIDNTIFRKGGQSVQIKRTGLEPYGKLGQSVPAVAWRGKKIRFSAWLRAENVQFHYDHAGLGEKSGAGLTLHITQSLGFLGTQDLFVDDMADRIVRGTQDWQKFEIEAMVDPKATNIEVAVNLTGTGRIWLDDAVLEEVLPGPTVKPRGIAGSRNHRYRTQTVLEKKGE